MSDALVITSFVLQKLPALFEKHGLHIHSVNLDYKGACDVFIKWSIPISKKYGMWEVHFFSLGHSITAQFDFLPENHGAVRPTTFDHRKEEFLVENPDFETNLYNKIGKFLEFTKANRIVELPKEQ